MIGSDADENKRWTMAPTPCLGAITARGRCRLGVDEQTISTPCGSRWWNRSAQGIRHPGSQQVGQSPGCLTQAGWQILTRAGHSPTQSLQANGDGG